MAKIQAIILAGGKGTRLAPLTDNLPKPLVAVCGKPMMTYVLEHLRAAGIVDVAISTAHLGHMIVDAFGDGQAMGMRITYLVEPEPMGTGGWAKLVNWDNLDDHFLVLNADNLTWIDVGAFLQRNRDREAIATLAAIELPSAAIANYEILRPSSDGTLLDAWVDRSRTVEELAGKETGFINSGWYVMTPRVREFVDDVLPFSNEVHLWPRLATSGERVGFYHETGPWFDTGTHERLARVESFLKRRDAVPLELSS
ncbi:MAG: NDP-sugar synthase [Patescibacteria group bacterium]